MRIIAILCMLLTGFVAQAQCPYISGVLADADASGTPTGEGKNEFVAFNTGSSAVAANTVFISYSTSTTTTNFSINGTVASPASVWTTMVTPGLLTNSLGSITYATSTTIIPANTNVVVIPSINTISYDLKTFGSSVYVLPYNVAAGSPRVVAYAAAGNFANSGGTPRYLRISVGTCRDTVDFIPSSLPGADGGGAKWNSAGVITYYNSGASGAVLPINLLHISGSVQSKNATLEWSTSGNSSADFFEIEKSINGIVFKNAGAIRADKQKTLDAKRYSFSDKGAGGIYGFYRLKMIDVDGSASYSSTIKLHATNSAGESFIYPNPANGQLFVDNKEEFTHCSIMGMMGTVMLKKNIEPGISALDIEALPPGLYLLQLNGDAGTKAFRFTKQ